MELMLICDLCLGKDCNSKIHFVFTTPALSLSVSLLVYFSVWTWSFELMLCGQKFMATFDRCILTESHHNWSFYCLFIKKKNLFANLLTLFLIFVYLSSGV